MATVHSVSPQGVFMRLLHDKPEVAVRQSACPKADYRLGVLGASVAVNGVNSNIAGSAYGDKKDSCGKFAAVI